MDPRFSKAIGAMIGGMTGYILAIYALDLATKETYEVISEANDILSDINKNTEKTENKENMGKRKRRKIKGSIEDAEPKVDYEKHFRYNKKEDLKELVKRYNGEEVTEVEERLTQATDPDAPMIVDIQEAFELINSLHYNHVVLNYYQEDDILTTSDDKPLPSNYESLLGPDALVSFVPGTVNTIYVKNPKTTVVYEINYFDGSYNLLVLGIDEPEVESSTRTAREVDEE